MNTAEVISLGRYTPSLSCKIKLFLTNSYVQMKESVDLFEARVVTLG